MKNLLLFILIILMISTNVHAQKQVTPESLMKLKLGEKIPGDLKQANEFETFSYEIESENNHLKSLSIYLNPPAEIKKFLAQNQKGHCLIYRPPGDVKIERYFFFDIKKNIRYEITPLKQISKIFIQDMSDAVEHPDCKINEIFKKVGKK